VRKLIRFRLRYGFDVDEDHLSLAEMLREAKIAWRLLLDTSLASPDDIHERKDAPPVDSSTYRAAPRSVAVLVADI
jgi:hypothetical protein